jgi:hypothetical protein
LKGSEKEDDQQIPSPHLELSDELINTEREKLLKCCLKEVESDESEHEDGDNEPEQEDEDDEPEQEDEDDEPEQEDEDVEPEQEDEDEHERERSEHNQFGEAEANVRLSGNNKFETQGNDSVDMILNHDYTNTCAMMNASRFGRPAPVLEGFAANVIQQNTPMLF